MAQDANLEEVKGVSHMEKLRNPTQLRLTETMFQEIRRFAAQDDRKFLHDAIRRLLHVGLEATRGYGPIYLSGKMAEEIRELAEAEDRAYFDEVRHLLRLALEQKRKPASRNISRGQNKTQPCSK